MLDRLKLGTYSDLYEDLLNIDKEEFDKHLEENKIEESDIEELESLEEFEDFEYVTEKR